MSQDVFQRSYILQFCQQHFLNDTLQLPVGETGISEDMLSQIRQKCDHGKSLICECGRASFQLKISKRSRKREGQEVWQTSDITLDHINSLLCHLIGFI